MTTEEAIKELEKLDFKMMDNTSWVKFKDVGALLIKFGSGK